VSDFTRISIILLQCLSLEKEQKNLGSTGIIYRNKIVAVEDNQHSFSQPFSFIFCYELYNSSEGTFEGFWKATDGKNN